MKFDNYIQLTLDYYLKILEKFQIVERMMKYTFFYMKN